MSVGTDLAHALSVNGPDASNHQCTPTFVYRYRPTPAYPAMSKKQHHAGTVVLDIAISSAGTPAAVTVFESSGYPELDQSALATASTWRLSPVICKETGKPAQVRLRVPIKFGA
ncbi:energy transducer TonB [Dyella sp. 20L07]|uniref:energy transducer TonB n=1 Tax=Dyella sp. 20L07 TaxID=3384240 RepID=UPI003D2CB6B0